MRVALLADTTWESTATLRRMFVGARWDVAVNPAWNDLRGFELAVLRTHPFENEEARDLYRRWLVLDGLGVPSLNSPASVHRALDKAVTGRLFQAAAIPIPRTRVCMPGEAAPRFGTRLVVKPLDGYGSRDVEVVDDAVAADRVLRRTAGPRIVQEYVRGPLWRVVASPEYAIRVYRLRSDERGITVAPELQVREPVHDPDEEVCELGARAVRALGGDIMGVDIMGSPQAGGLRLIEANAAFGFNADDTVVADELVRIAQRLATGSPVLS